MLVLIIFGIISCLGFRRKLIAKGYPESKAWMFPGFVGAFLITFNYLLTFLSGFWMKDPETGIARSYPAIVSFLTLLVFGLVVSKLWKQVKNLPDLSSGQ